MNLGMKKVLVVDDSAVMRGIVKRTLNKLGLKNIVEADDGRTALAELKKEKIDLILSDLNMPDIDGLELLKTVKSDARLKGIAFLLMTLEGQRETLLEAVKAGANDYLKKPITSGALSKKLDKIFGK